MTLTYDRLLTGTSAEKDQLVHLCQLHLKCTPIIILEIYTNYTDKHPRLKVKQIMFKFTTRHQQSLN
jgi:hypothetical protein